MTEFTQQAQLGFGYLRVPMKDGKADPEASNALVDRFLEKGYNYFDTARGYMDEMSEDGLRECLVKRHPRESYLIADKLTIDYVAAEADILPFFESQLGRVGVEYFDFYLIHTLMAKNYQKFLDINAFEALKRLKAEGRVRHIGFSFHDTADLLEEILKNHPEMEFVQIQFNYEDFEDPAIQSRKLYEVCEAYGKPVIVMEPLKGGNLARLPEKAAKLLSDLGGGSPASYGLRFAASFPNIKMILSGMTTTEDVDDNAAAISAGKPLTEAEFDAIGRVREILQAEQAVKCTACRYCVKGCPMDIPIPEIFSAYNTQKRYGDWNSKMYYSNSVRGKGRASACIGCGACEDVCPQHLPIRDHLADAAEMFDKKKA